MDYSQLSADEAAQMLGAIYMKQLEIIKDKKKGFLRTSFGVFSVIPPHDLAKLRDAVLEKNGIEKIQAEQVCHDYSSDIISAVEARGSRAAEGIKYYQKFTNACDRAAEDTPGFKDMSGLRQAKLKMTIAKSHPHL